MDYELSYAEIKKIVGPGHLSLIEPFERDDILNSIIKDIITGKSGNKVNRYVIFYNTDVQGGVRKGHWVAMVIDNKHKKCYWFDSYGIYPDDEIYEIDKHYRQLTDQDKRYYGKFLFNLTKLGYLIDYNSTPLQDRETGIKTCGRYVALFLKMNKEGKYPTSKFVKYLSQHLTKKESTYDNVVLKLTKDI